MNHVVSIAAQDDRLFPHARDEVVAWLLDLVLEPHEQPTAGKDPLLLDLVQHRIDEDIPAHQTLLPVDKVFCVQVSDVQRHRNTSFPGGPAYGGFPLSGL